MTAKNNQRTRWCFTINNYTEEELKALTDNITEDNVKFGIAGLEVGDSGTPHIQGFLSFRKRCRLAGVKRVVGSRAHIEPAMGNDEQNEDYCTKDGAEILRVGFPSKGTTQAGGGSQLAALLPGIVDSIRNGDTITEICDADPAGAAGIVKYGKRVEELVRHEDMESTRRAVAKTFDGVEWKKWQEYVVEYIHHEVDPREILWIVDERGGQGKTYLAKYLITNHDCFRAENGKSADIKYAYRGERIVIFDFNRSCEDRVNYEVIESIKNGFYFSTKYVSEPRLYEQPHVICFSNFAPDITKLSIDRWWILNISENCIVVCCISLIGNEVNQIKISLDCPSFDSMADRL